MSAELEFNYKQTKKLPINRNNLFYSENDFLFEEEIGKDYIEQDVNQRIILFQVDLEKTNIDTLYNETKKDNIVFKTPIELPCLYEVEDSELRTYDTKKNLGFYKKTGKLDFIVYESVLQENDCDIKIGDYVGIQIDEEHVEYFVVNDDGRNNYGNSQTMYGYKPFYRHCTAAPVDKNEFNGI